MKAGKDCLPAYFIIDLASAAAKFFDQINTALFAKPTVIATKRRQNLAKQGYASDGKKAAGFQHGKSEYF